MENVKCYKPYLYLLTQEKNGLKVYVLWQENDEKIYMTE
jgi:hypothetical protein